MEGMLLLLTAAFSLVAPVAQLRSTLAIMCYICAGAVEPPCAACHPLLCTARAATGRRQAMRACRHVRAHACSRPHRPNPLAHAVLMVCTYTGCCDSRADWQKFVGKVRRLARGRRARPRPARAHRPTAAAAHAAAGSPSLGARPCARPLTCAALPPRPAPPSAADGADGAGRAVGPGLHLPPPAAVRVRGRAGGAGRRAAHDLAQHAQAGTAGALLLLLLLLAGVPTLPRGGQGRGRQQVRRAGLRDDAGALALGQGSQRCPGLAAALHEPPLSLSLPPPSASPIAASTAR